MSVTECAYPFMAADQLRDAGPITPSLIAEIIQLTCRRFPSAGQPGKTARIRLLLDAQAWIDAGLALIDLELPSWHVRRIAYDSGEWYCALSRQRELPDWLDKAIEARHPDLALAILMAFVEAQQAAASCSGTSVPATSGRLSSGYIPLYCDNIA